MNSEEAFKKQLEELSKLVVVPPDFPTKADDQNAQEAVQAEGEFYERQLQEQTLADRRSARTQRETYAKGIFRLVCVWIFLIFILLLLQGFSAFVGYKPLSDPVLITLVSSTTVNVIGTLIIVLKYIFKVAQPAPDDPPTS